MTTLAPGDEAMRHAPEDDVRQAFGDLSLLVKLGPASTRSMGASSTRSKAVESALGVTR